MHTCDLEFSVDPTQQRLLLFNMECFGLGMSCIQCPCLQLWVWMLILLSTGKFAGIINVAHAGLMTFSMKTDEAFATYSPNGPGNVTKPAFEYSRRALCSAFLPQQSATTLKIQLNASEARFHDELLLFWTHPVSSRTTGRPSVRASSSRRPSRLLATPLPRAFS